MSTIEPIRCRHCGRPILRQHDRVLPYWYHPDGMTTWCGSTGDPSDRAEPEGEVAAESELELRAAYGDR